MFLFYYAEKYDYEKYILPAIIFIIPFIATAQSNQTFNYYNFKTDKDTIFYNE